MAKNVRVRVSKWDIPEETRVSGGFQLENNQPGNEDNSHSDRLMSDRGSSKFAEGQISTFANPQEDNACCQIQRPDSEPEAVLSKTGSELSNGPKTSELDTCKTDVIPWGPIPESKTKSENGNANKSDVDSGDRDNSWGISNENNASLDHTDNASIALGRDVWQQGIRSTSPKIGGGSYRNLSRSRSRSRSLSPAPGYRREDNWNDRNKSGPRLYHAPCRTFMAGRCTRGSQCRYLHEDGGRNYPDRPNKPDTADERERYDRGRPTVYDSKEHFAESVEAKGSSQERFSYGKRNRYDEDRKEDDDFRNKKSTVLCIDYTRGKCHRGSVCRYAHHDDPHDGKCHDKGGERERANDRGQTNFHSGQYLRHESRRTNDILCKFFAEGRCRNGDKCRFSHQGPVQSAPAVKPDDVKWGSHGGSEIRPMWNGPRWGDPVTTHAQSSVSGCGGDNSDTLSGASHALNKSSTLSNEACQIVYPVQGQNTVTETSRQHQWYDTSLNSQCVENFSVQQPVDIKGEIFSHENVSMKTKNSSENEANSHTSNQPGIVSFPGQSTDQFNQGQQVVSQASNTQLINQTCQTKQIVPPNPFGTNTSAYSTVPNAKSQYFGSQAHPSSQNIGGSSHYPSFGGQGQHIHSQPPNGMVQYPDLHPIANVQVLNTNEQSQQSTKFGYAVQDDQGNHSPELDKRGTESTDGINSNNKNVVTSEQMSQITNLSASLAQIFGNGQQLPQLYAALNPNAPEITPTQPSSQPNSVLPAPSAAPVLQPNTDLWSQQHQNPISSGIMPANSGGNFLSSQIPSNSFEQTVMESEAPPKTLIPKLPTIGPNIIGDHNGSTNSAWKMNENKMITTCGQNGSGKLNEIPTDQGKDEPLTGPPQGGSADPEFDKGGKKDTDKDAKGIRIFKYTLVDLVKEMLKPTWKEGNMSKEVHKTIVKKVVDKVTGALQSNIPQTQERIDFYLEHSKGKLSKLVQDYVEKYAKA